MTNSLIGAIVRFVVIIGVSGQMAAGKNAACEALAKEGWLCIDFDDLAHEALDLSAQEVALLFADSLPRGVSLLDESGKVRRDVLARLVFGNPQRLLALEKILHPKVNEIARAKIASLGSGAKVVLNATLLHKSSLAKECRAVIFVSVNPFLRFFRARRRNKMPFSQILKRFFAQRKLFSQFSEISADKFIVKNCGSRADLKKSIDIALQKISFV